MFSGRSTFLRARGFARQETLCEQDGGRGWRPSLLVGEGTQVAAGAQEMCACLGGFYVGNGSSTVGAPVPTLHCQTRGRTARNCAPASFLFWTMGRPEARSPSRSCRSLVAGNAERTVRADHQRIAVERLTPRRFDRDSAPQARIDRPVDKRRASHPLPQAAFKLASFLRQPRLAHAFENGLKLGQIRRIVAHRRPGGAGAGDGEGRVERETGLDGGTRLVKSTKLREGGGQRKIFAADNFGWPRSPVETTRPLAPNCRAWFFAMPA